MKLFVAVTGHATLLPHFLSHYSQAGVSAFFIATEPELESQIRRAASSFSAHIVSTLDCTESIEGGTAAVSAMRRSFAGPEEWVVLADLDEFQVHPSGVVATARAADLENANVVRGRFIDRVASDGLLKPIGPHDDLWTLFPERCHVTALLQGGLDYKCALVKGGLASGRTPEGLSLAHHHMVDERLASTSVEIHHFKWNAEALERIPAAMARTRSANQPFWVEYERVLEHLRQHGRLRWQDFAALPDPTAGGS